MPRIEPYGPPIPTLQPTERGIDARTQAARRIGTFYNQAAGAISGAAEARAKAAGDMYRAGEGLADTVIDAAKKAEDFAGHQAVNTGIKTGSGLLANLGDDWGATFKEALTKNPDDPSVGARWRQDVLEPAIDKFKESMGWTDAGRAFGEKFGEQLRSHFERTTAADMSTLAAAGVQRNVASTISSLSRAAHDDPSSLDFTLKSADDAIGHLVSSNPNLSNAESVRIGVGVSTQAQREIFNAGVKGAIDKNPDAGLKFLSDARYSKFVTPEVIDQFKTYAQGVTRLRDAAASHASAEVQRKQDDTFTRSLDDLEAKILPQNAGDPVRLPDGYFQAVHAAATNNDDAAARNPTRLRDAIVRGEAVTARLNAPEPEAAVSHASTNDLLARARSATDPAKIASATNAVYSAYKEGKISSGDFATALTTLNQMKTPAGAVFAQQQQTFFQSMRPAIVGTDPDGASRFYNFQADVARKLDEYRRTNRDPSALLNPASGEYLGKPAAIAAYQRPALQSSLPAMAATPLQASATLSSPTKPESAQSADSSAAHGPPMTPVSSSFVGAVGHDGRDLYVTLKKGGTYKFENVPAGEAANIANAPSPGKYFGENIRSTYQGKPVEGARAAPPTRLPNETLDAWLARTGRGLSP